MLILQQHKAFYCETKHTRLHFSSLQWQRTSTKHDFLSPPEHCFFCATALPLPSHGCLYRSATENPEALGCPRPSKNCHQPSSNTRFFFSCKVVILSIGSSTICKCHVAWSQLRNTFSHPSGQWRFCEISAPWNPSVFPSYIDNHSCFASGEKKKKGLSFHDTVSAHCLKLLIIAVCTMFSFFTRKS